jgi:peptidoglycan/LPS O-acetylase OafA/YrhL
VTAEPRSQREAARLALAARLAFAATALAVVLLPWYTLDDYTPNGWDASWWIRLALLAALLGLALGAAGEAGRLRHALAAAAVAAIAFRLAVPPDFGFDFDGLDVPTERAWGAYVGLATALGALLAEGLRLRARPAPPDPSPGSLRSGTGSEASSSAPAGPAPA